MLYEARQNEQVRVLLLRAVFSKKFGQVREVFFTASGVRIGPLGSRVGMAVMMRMGNRIMCQHQE